MKITWRGHACFAIESAGYRIMLDPYHEVTGLPDISGEVNEVLCSHFHRDHSYVEELTILGGVSPFTVEKVDCFHDDQQGALRGTNVIHILSAEGVRVAHLGDLGHMPEEELEKKLTGLDVLLIPIGGTYTLSAEQAAELVKRLKPRMTIPMHYRKGSQGYEVLQTVEEFLQYFDGETICHCDGNSMEVGEAALPAVAVLTYRG